jgi:hypothetical protein
MKVFAQMNVYQLSLEIQIVTPFLQDCISSANVCSSALSDSILQVEIHM